jgi:RND family efflux transporter MFP subunit
MNPDDVERLLTRTRGPAVPSRLRERLHEEWTRTPRPKGRVPWLLTAAAILFFAITVAGIANRGLRRPAETGGTGASPAQGRVSDGSGGAGLGAQEGGAFLALPGELKPYREVEIYAKVQAHVVQLEVDRGSHVKQGQVLVRLRAPELQAQCDEARAQFALDEGNLQRIKALQKAALLSVTDQDAALAQSKADIARARLKTCEANLAYLEISAPFDGVITNRELNVGSLVGPPATYSSRPLFTLQDTVRLRVEVLIPEGNVAAALKAKGHSISFTVDGLAGEAFTGTVARLADSIDPRTRTMAAELDVDNSLGRLLAGMSARVKWPVGQ